MVVKFTFQSVFGNSRQNPRHASARGHSSCILSFDLIGQYQNKRFHVTEIVLPLEFADVIFGRKRSDDRKYVCLSQAMPRMRSKFFFGATLRPLSHFVSPVFTMIMHSQRKLEFSKKTSRKHFIIHLQVCIFSKMMRNIIEYNAVTIKRPCA